MVSVLVMLFRFWAKMSTNNRIAKVQTRNVLLWLFGFVFIIGVVIICFAILSYSFLKGPNPDLTQLKTSLPMDIISFFLLTIPLSMLFFPELLYGIPQRGQNINDYLVYQNEKTAPEEQIILIKDAFSIEISDVLDKGERNLSEEELQKKDIEPRFIELSQSILDYIRKSEIFLNPNFSMEELSRSMNVPKHHLYYCFNSILKVKLTKIRAELRVEYAKKLIKDGLSDTLTLDAIGNKAGFSSRSSFQSIFKEEVGCTPGEYLKTKGSHKISGEFVYKQKVEEN